MKPNRITIGADETAPLFAFDDSSIDVASINISTAVDVIGAELSIDAFTATVRYPPDIAELFSPSDYDGILTADGYMFATSRAFGDIRLTPYATPLFFRRDNELVGKFYVRNVDRISRDAYKVTAMSAIGILDTQKHNGGLYTGQTFGDVVADIIGDAVDYYVDPDVAAMYIFGWLPIDTKRRNLHRLLIAEGVTLSKDDGGDIAFIFLVKANEPRQIPSSRIYYGGSVDYNAPATAVEVTEHAFSITAADESVVVFDNTQSGEPAVDLFVTFRDAPVHDLVASAGLIVSESGVNYAVVSGTGTLTGKKYTHVTRIVKREVDDPAGAEKVVSLDAGLAIVNALNSDNVADRLLSYYASAKTVKAAIVYDGERSGSQIGFDDPYGDASTGFIESMDLRISAIAKANCTIVTDFTPSGQGNNYQNMDLLTGDGDWEVKAETIKVALIGGGSGGNRGANGDRGKGAATPEGHGGAGGAGGLGGKVYIVTITGLTIGDTISFSCGSGGASDTDGGDTVFGSYSSASGSRLSGGYIYLATGDRFALAGNAGVAGADSGKPLTFDGVTYTAGRTGAVYRAGQGYANGGGGGGATAGANGGDGDNGSWAERQGVFIGFVGGWGGAGADAAITGTDATQYGCGGNGGHGGGQGGTGGDYYDPVGLPDDTEGGGGTGGAGSLGGNGADGCIVVFY